MTPTCYQMAQRFIGLREAPGAVSNPQVLQMLRLDQKWPTGDHVPWCSAFVNYIAWLMRMPRSKSLRARSWLRVGLPVVLSQAQAGNDVVVLRNKGGPGASVLEAPGHVGLFAGMDGSSRVLVLGGNQKDEVNVSSFPAANVLGVRRLA